MFEKKKRVRKTQLLVTSLVLTCFLSSFSFVHAIGYNYSPHYFSFTHGSVSVGTSVSEDTYVQIATTCSFSFDNYYTGTVTLKWSYNSSDFEANITQWSIVVYGGKIDTINNSNGSIVFRVYDTKSFQVIMYHFFPGTSAPTNDPGFNFTSASSSLNAVTNHNSEYDNIKSIDARLQTMNNNLIDLISAANNAQAYLGDISGYVDGVEGYLAKQYNGTYDSDVEQLLNSIKTDQQTGNTTLSSVNTRISNLQNYLQTVIGVWDINDPPLNIIQALNSIAGDMTSLESEVSTLSSYVNDIKTKVNSINDKLTLMQQDLASLLATVQNIDNLIDSISWKDINVTFDGYSLDGNNFTVPTSQTTIRQGYSYIKFSGFFNGNGNSVLHYMKLPIAFNTLSERYKNNIEFEFYSSSMVKINDVSYYSFNVGGAVYLFFNLVSSGTNAIVIKPITSSLYYYDTSLSYFEKYILSNDIEYWQLISYFNEYNYYKSTLNYESIVTSKLDDILTAINNISMNVNITDQQVQNITENFDQDINTIHNIENNFGLNFDGWDDQISSDDVSFNLTDYNSAISLIKTNITSLWSSPLISLPILVSCLCFIFLVILG